MTPAVPRPGTTLINLIFENQEKYTTIEDLLTELKLQTGWYREHVSSQPHPVTRQISRMLTRLVPDGELCARLVNEIGRIARDAGIPIVEDNAHGLMGNYQGQPLGTFGTMATQSFHETKNLTCGKGGALLVNDPALVERARIVREKGTNRTQFLQGRVDKYTWVDLGSSYLPSDLLSAFLLCQLEERARIQEMRGAIWRRYAENLSDWAQSENVSLPTVPAGVEHTSHLFYLLLPTATDRTRLIDYLAEHGIHAVFHYSPLHLSSMGQELGGTPGECPVAEDVSTRLVRLPFFTGLSETNQAYVIDTIKEFRSS